MAIQGDQLVIFEWCMVGMTLGFVAVRLYIRIRNHPQRWSSRRRPSVSTGSIKSKPSISNASGKPSDTESGAVVENSSSTWHCPWLVSDIFVVFAWLSFVGQAGMDTALNAEGFFKPDRDPMNPVEPNGSATTALKLYFAENVTYLNCMFAVKAAMLCLFHEFFPKEMKKVRICLWVTDALVIVSFLAGLFITLFYCLPLDRNWARNPERYCSSLDHTAVVVIAVGSHILTDIIIYTLPIIVVRKLRHRLPRWQRLGITLTFGAGFLCVFFAVALLAASYMAAEFATYYTFCVFEQTWAIVVVCLPAIKLLASSNRWRWIRRVRDEMECTHGYRATHMDLLHGQPRVVTSGRTGSLSVTAHTVQSTLTEPEKALVKEWSNSLFGSTLNEKSVDLNGPGRERRISFNNHIYTTDTERQQQQEEQRRSIDEGIQVASDNTLPQNRNSHSSWYAE